MTARRTAVNVMVVDDNPANLKLMGDMLGQQGYEARLFPRGRLALASAAQRPPDLILLDINMPEMDGYEVCRRLKADADLAQIPVIFLSALHETADKVKGLQYGGVDYISKPFQLEEVQARVQTQLRIQALQTALQSHNQKLEETVAARTRELQDAHAQLQILDGAKSDFLRLISHEFRTPLNGLVGVGELLLDGMPRTDENLELIGMFESSRKRILRLLDDALVLTEIGMASQKFRGTPVAFRNVVRRALERSAEFARELGVTIEATISGEWSVIGNEELLATALHALTDTGLAFVNSGTSLRVWDEASDGEIRFLIEGQGQTISPELAKQFFDPFSFNQCSIAGVGLRPVVARRILTLFGGTATVQNREGSGICLTASIKNVPSN
ncbi:MAG TPA: hybrid sensor histidine kinase/response regulator [Candidatus Limnocylindrales bacterium]|nr:hybrid sensor histidine kinase/response regulator [Candidatus Limnocylindrales bacterium]